MAQLRNLWDVATRKRPGVGRGVSPPGGGGRDIPGEDPVWSGEIPGQGPGIGWLEPGVGQQQFGPGTMSGPASTVDMWGGLSGEIDDYWFSDINNMTDLFDWWTNVGQHGGAGGFDSFYDWFSQLGPDYQVSPTENYAGGAMDWSIYPGMEFGPFGAEESYGGGTIGGQGDLGTGNVFIGGGMGSSMFGEGMTGQDCATLGPQFNSAGECISCCEEEYAGAGFYGTGEEYTGGGTGGGSIDPDISDCESMYNQAGGFDGTQLTLSEFLSMYC